MRSASRAAMSGCVRWVTGECVEGVGGWGEGGGLAGEPERAGPRLSRWAQGCCGHRKTGNDEALTWVALMGSQAGSHAYRPTAQWRLWATYEEDCITRRRSLRAPHEAASCVAWVIHAGEARLPASVPLRGSGCATKCRSTCPSLDAGNCTQACGRPQG